MQATNSQQVNHTHNTRRPATPPQNVTQTRTVTQSQTRDNTTVRQRYSTVLSRTEEHSQTITPQQTCPQEQQMLPTQQQQNPERQTTHNIAPKPTQGERSRALEELRRLERETNLRERSALEQIAIGNSNQQLVPRPSSPKSPRRRRGSGGRGTNTVQNHMQEVQQLKEQVSKLQTELQQQQQTLRRQQEQLKESQAKLTAETKQLREERLKFENEKRRHSQHSQTSQDSDTDTYNHRPHRSARRYSRLDHEFNFGERAENVAYALRHKSSIPVIPRLLNAFYEAYTRLRADPEWHTLPEVLMSIIGHLIGSYDHTY